MRGSVNTISKKLSEIKDVIVEKDSSSVGFEHESADDASLIKETLK
nr:hypothetical protein [Allomuricauda sp.]